MIKKYIILLAIALIFASCNSTKWSVAEVSSVKIAMDTTKDRLADQEYMKYVLPMQQKIDAEMNVVIGTAAQNMRAHKPESLLSNLSADIYKKRAAEFLKTPVDIAIVNLGGIRTQIAKGDITTRKVFELMPFENELVILWLRGNKLNELLQAFAAVGGQGVSGLRMTIENGKAVDITVGGQAIDPNRLYSIATNDYLAGGNDNMPQLAMYEKRENTSIKIRTMLLEYIKNETAKGNMIQSELDGRIK